MSGPRRRKFVGPIVSRVTWHGGRGTPYLRRWALIIALASEPGVPEVGHDRRAEVAAQLLAVDVQREVVPEFHPSHVLVEDRLDAVEQHLALLGVGIRGQLAEELVLFLLSPPPRPAALQAR